MMGRHMFAAWIWLLPLTIVFWGVVAAAVVLAFRAFGGPRSHDGGALEILRRRLASGEITPDEYEKTRQLLQR